MHVADSVELLLGHVDEMAVAPNACVPYNDIESTEDFAGLIDFAPDAATLSALATTEPPNAQASVPTSFMQRGVVAAAVVLAVAIVDDALSTFGGYEQRMLASNTALIPVVMTTRPSSVVIIGT